MENTNDSIFLTVPHEILVDLLLPLPTSSVINFCTVSSAHLKLFDSPHGLWEQLTRKIFKWSNLTLPVRKSDGGEDNAINWKKEYRVASFFNWSIRNNQLHAKASEANLSQLESISKNHFKAENASIDSLECYTIQSQTKLYPFPIGNFSTAYFEVKFINGDTSLYHICVGAAMDDFQGVVGTSIASYSLGAGDMYLENTIGKMDTESPEEEYAINPGLSVGFGINFANKSVFFTKNGKLLHETTENYYNEPLCELMNLHATVSMGNHEVKVNLGCEPFMFDLVKYQQQQSIQRPLELYSDIVAIHLCSAVELTGIHNNDKRLFAQFNNFPNSEVKLPEALYILLYGRIPPNSKYFAESDPQAVAQFQLYWTKSCWFLNSIVADVSDSRDLVLVEETPFLQSQIEVYAQHYGIKNYEAIPYDSLAKTVVGLVCREFAKTIGDWLSLCCSELAELAFGDSLSIGLLVSNTLQYLLAVVQYTAQPPENVWAMGYIFDYIIGGTHQSPPFNIMMINIMRMRTDIILGSVMMQNMKQLAKVKMNEWKQMKVVFGNDENLKRGYNKMIKDYLWRAEYGEPFYGNNVSESLKFNKIWMQMTAQQSINSPEITMILYGSYYLNIHPEDYETWQDFNQAVCKKNETLITDELKHQFLIFLQKQIVELEEHSNLFLLKALVEIFKIDVDLNVSIEDKVKICQLSEHGKNEIERMLATKNYGPA